MKFAASEANALSAFCFPACIIYGNNDSISYTYDTFDRQLASAAKAARA